MENTHIKIGVVNEPSKTIGYLLKNDPQIEFFKTSKNPLIMKTEIKNHNPDLLIWSFPTFQSNHIDIVCNLKESFPNLRILVLANEFSRALIPDILVSCIDGVLTRSKVEQYLTRAIEQIYHGIFTMFIDDV